MEFLVVAAATGATYAAKYWQQFNSEEKEGSSEPVSDDLVYGQSRKLYQQFRDRALPLPRLGQKQSGSEAVWDGLFPEVNRSGGVDNETGIASTSGAGAGDGNVLSLMNLSTGLYGNGRENFHEIGYGSGKGMSEFSDRSGYGIGETGSIRIRRIRNVRNRNLRNRSLGYLVKPVNSLESCLTAQLFKEHARMEEHVYNSLPSPSISTVRPLLVTNGNRIISRASCEVRRDSGLGEREMCSRMGSIELPRKPKLSFAKQRRSSRLSISSTRVSEGPQNSQGSMNGILLFFLGITIGIISTVVANQRELNKLNELLKQSENLVQDLHEELEMKHFSSMKELPSKEFESPTSNKQSSEQELNEHTKYDETTDGNGAEKSELMNKIEAELEAELEKLELSMKESSLDRLSKLVELDPGLVADVVQGELELDKVNRQPGGAYDSDHDVSGTSTTYTHPANYAVPPMELSLRLHEVIQSRLEARIMELEAALESSQQRRHSMESEHIISRGMLYSESESLSTQESPTCRDEGSESDHPMVMNLTGEALDAYNEAYEEMYRMVEIDEETSLETVHESDHIQKEIHPEDKILLQGRNGNVEERRSRNLLLDKLRTAEEETTRSWGSNELEESEEEEDDDDELEKLLIKQIVERTKKGSPAILNVQQMLYSMNDQ